MKICSTESRSYMSDNKVSTFIRLGSSAIPLLLVSYVLSIGPVVVSLEDSNGNLPPQYHAPLRSFYAPLVWIIDKNQTCRKFYAEYHRICSPHY